MKWDKSGQFLVLFSYKKLAVIDMRPANETFGDVIDDWKVDF